MYKYIYPLIKCKIKPWLKYYIVKKGEGTLSEIITSASPITLVNSLRKKFIKFIVGGNSIQDGEPSPETQVPIQNVTGNVEVKVENKNLAYITSKSEYKYSSTLENGEIKINGTSSQAGNINIRINGSNGLILKPNKTYVLSVIMEGTVSGGQYKNIYVKGSSIGALASNTTRTLTITPTEDYIIPNINLDLAANITFTNFTIKIQVEENSATSYEPHEEQTATFPLEEGQVLHEGDTIEDKIVQKRKTIILTGKEDLGRNAEYSGRFSFLVKGYENTIDTNNLTDIYCNIATASLGSEINTIRIASNGTIVITVQSNFSEYTVVAIKNKVRELYEAGTPIIIEIPLSEPIEIPFTEAQRTAKAQIDKLYSYKGTTHISSTNEPSPIFEVQYYMEGE